MKSLMPLIDTPDRLGADAWELILRECGDMLEGHGELPGVYLSDKKTRFWWEMESVQ